MNVHTSDEPITTELFIDGEARPSATGRTYEIHNPARPSELVGHAAAADASDIDAAARAAHAAFPAWSALSYDDRATYLRKITEELVADEADVAYRSRLFCREHGKILKETLLEMSRLGDRFMLTASYADRLAADEHI